MSRLQKTIDCLRDECIEISVVAHIAGYRFAASACGFDQVFRAPEAIRVVAGGDNGCPGFGQSQRDRLPDALGCAGNERDLTGQVEQFGNRILAHASGVPSCSASKAVSQ